ncbi:MAG: MarR family transcriptional regulator [Bdellovibrionales bacterium]|jgi:DNA-binding MarR family transcriptional regulator|nr:MarR family transcriptional regulator [Bdellovibrionales bacterium]
MSLQKEQINEILKLGNQLCFPFYAASRLIVQAYTPALEKLNITYPQYLVLMVLWEKDGQSVKDIGKKLFLDSGTLTPLMQKLVSHGLIARVRAKRDDRIVLNMLTPAGRDLKAKAAEMSFSLFCKSGLTIEEAEQMRTTAKSLISKMTKLKTLKENSEENQLAADIQI